MKYLYDTNFVSEWIKPQPNAGAMQFLNSLSGETAFISIVSIGEIWIGTHLLSEGSKKQQYSRWVERLESEFRNQFLSCDLETSRIWGELTARHRSQGLSPRSADMWIAATAIQNELHLVTRNVKDFQSAGVQIINPWT